MAQGETTSAIVGTVTDSSGAAVAGAMVTIVGADTGSKRSARTDDAGRFNFPQLKPGMYSVKAEADRFESRTNESVWAGLGQRQTVAFILTPAGVKGEVTVTSLAPLVNPDNPNTSTTLNAVALENLPNPGGDMTYPLQFAAGALMNTAGSSNDFVGGTNGYGNVQFNGLPALANGYIRDVEAKSGTVFRMVPSPLQFDERPPDLTRAPDHGEHTDEVIGELGYDRDALMELKIKGVIL